MAQKVSIDQKSKSPKVTKFEDIIKDMPEISRAGIRPYIEDPHKVINRAMRNSIFICLFICVISGALIYYAILQIKQKSADLQNTQNLIYLTNSQAQNKSQLIGQYEKIAPNLEKIKASLPSSNDLLSYVGALDSLAKAVGVEQNVQFQPLSAQTKPSNIPGQTNSNESLNGIEHTVQLKGRLSQFSDYLAGLEKLPYFTAISSFTISANKNAGEESSASIVVKIFTNKESKP